MTSIKSALESLVVREWTLNGWQGPNDEIDKNCANQQLSRHEETKVVPRVSYDKVVKALELCMDQRDRANEELCDKGICDSDVVLDITKVDNASILEVLEGSK